MTSLLSYASPWQNSGDSRNNNSATRKRVPSMNPPPSESTSSINSIRKTQRNKITDPKSELNSYSFLEKEGPSTIEETQEYQNTRANHIHNMLNKMNSVRIDNDGSPLENFSSMPTESPIEDIRFSPSTGEESPDDKSFSKSPTSDKIGEMTRKYMNTPNPMFIQSYSTNETPLSSSSLGNSISSYKDSYSSKPVITPSTLMEGLDSMGMNKITEKMNYVIYLLEQQQHEETHHITEEFLLYTFLGVFIIYIVDSFSRAGKYIR